VIRGLGIVFVVGAVLLADQPPSHAVRIGALIDAERAAQTLEVRDVRVDGATLLGRLLNRSGGQISGVRLFIRHTFHWNDEFRPGNDHPGSVQTLELAETVPPGGEHSFTASIQAPPQRGDGWFTIDVMVLGFTEVGEALGARHPIGRDVSALR
jgi:hypothetical protein